MQLLSQRLLAVASLATAGDCVADVGTDHGYIPIYLLEQGKYEKAIAMDLRKGPLMRARENRDLHGLTDRMDLRLGDGVLALKPGEADTVVIAGMGGGLVVKILTEGAEILAGIRKLVLQPQSELTKVREFLETFEYRIEEEHMVLEDGKYYPMMRVVHGTMEPMDQLEKKYGPLLLKEKHPCLRQFLDWEEKKLFKIQHSLLLQPGERTMQRLKEVEEDLADIKTAKERMI